MLYILLQRRWCDILNVLAPIEDKVVDVKDSFPKELEHVFDKFPKYHMKILLGDFNAKVGMEYIFKPRIGDDSLRKISNNPEWSKRRCFIATAVQLCFGICHLEGPGKPVGTEIKWDTSAACLF
jgi:hypothetical protein